MSRQTVGTRLSGWCMTDYHDNCFRDRCTCECHNRQEDK